MSFNPENFFLKRMGNCEFKLQYRNYTFIKSETTFGRAKECDIILKNMRCSLNHCKISFENGKIFIEDSSSAGTFVNNERLRGRKVELFEGSIVGMGADPSREEHVNKTNFYIYKVQKVEAPIDLDSSDEENVKTMEKVSTFNSQNEENLHLENKINYSQNIAAIIETGSNDQQAVDKSATNIKSNKENQSDSDETVCFETNENLEDLTQKIEAHLTASVRSKLSGDSSSRQNQIMEFPVTSESKIHIKKELSINTSIEKLKSLRNISSAKIQQQNSEKSPFKTSSENGSSKINPLLKNTTNLLDLDKYPSISSNISAEISNAAPLPDDLQPEWISSSFVPDCGSGMDFRDLVLKNTCEKALKDLEVSVPNSSNFTLGCSNFLNQSLNLENESSDLPPEPPIFTPGPSNFQPIPVHLAEASLQKLTEEKNLSFKFSNLAENPNYLPSSTHLQQPPLNITTTPGITSGRKLSNLALRKKIQPSTSSSSDTFQSYSRSSSTQSTNSSTSIASSKSLKSDEQLKSLTSDQTKSKTNYEQCTKLIDIPSATPNLNMTKTSEDLLDEVEGPKDPLNIFWKQGIAVVRNENKAIKKRGRKKKTEDSAKESRNSNVEKSESKIESSEPPKTESIVLKSKSSVVSSKDGDKYLKNEDKASKSQSPTKLKATARKTTNTGAVVTKRPFAVIDEKISKSEDSDSSNDYQRAHSKNSDSENLEEMTRNPKRQKIILKLETEVNDSNDHATAFKTSYQNTKKSPIEHQHSGDGPKMKTSIPTSSESKQLEKFPDSDTENATKSEESRNTPRAACESGHGRSKIRKKIQRRESIIHQKRPNVKKDLQSVKNSPEIQKNRVSQSPQKSSSLQSMAIVPPSGPSSRPSIHQSSPNDNSSCPPSPTQKFHDKFPHLYLGLNKNDSKADSGSLSPPTPSGSTKSIPMKKRRQSVFDEQAQLIPENLTLNERSNAMRRWNQNTTKLIDIQPEDPRKRRKGRPKLNEDEKIKMLVEKSRSNEEKT